MVSPWVFVAGFTRNPAPVTIEGNTIINPLSADAITISNQGPTFIVGNTVCSVIDATGPVVRMNADGFCYDNVFTVADPVVAAGRNLIQNNKTVRAGTLKKQPPPQPVMAITTTKRPIIEVPAGTNATTIQAAINRAAKLKGKRPLVHLPYGKYTISSTIVIPEGCDLQLVGDGFGDHNSTLLSWSGQKGQPMLRIDGPSTCTLRDFTLKSNDASTNVLVTNADRPGSVIGLQEFHQIGGQTGLFADQLEHCRIFSWDGAFSGLQSAVKVIGPGKPSGGAVFINSGAASDNVVTHEVANGGALFVADEWYEGRIKSIFAQLSGSSIFTATGCHIAVPEHSDEIKLTEFTGKAIFTSDDMSGVLTADHNSTGALIIAGTLTEEEPFLSVISSKLHITRVINRTRNHGSAVLYGGSLRIDDNGTYPINMVEDPGSHSASETGGGGRTNIFIYRVMSVSGTAGVIIKH